MFDSIISAYNAINNLPITEGMITISSLICALIIISKIISALQEAMQDGQIEIKSFFKLISSYVYLLLAIAIAPPAISLFEKALAEMSDELTEQHQSGLTESADSVIQRFVETKNKEISEANTLSAVLLSIKLPAEVLFYTIIVFISKFLLYIFASARYLYLAILRIGMPIAIVCSISEKTRHITEAYLKNLFYCYIMLPCFLLANNFGEQIVSNLHQGGFGISQTEVSILILGLLLKMFLFGKAFQYAKQII